MKQWEINLYTTVLASDMYGQVQKSHSIARNHSHFVSPVPQEMADQMFEHLITSNNEEVLAFLQKTHHPSLPTLKTCLQNVVRNNANAPTLWNWISDELNRHPTNDIRTQIKPLRVLENTFRSSVKAQTSVRCLQALQPHLEQKEIDVLTLFARNNGHTRAGRQLLKHATLNEVEKLCHTYYTPTDTDLPKMLQEIEMERSRRTKNVLKKQVAGKGATLKRKM